MQYSNNAQRLHKYSVHSNIMFILLYSRYGGLLVQCVIAKGFSIKVDEFTCVTFNLRCDIWD